MSMTFENIPLGKKLIQGRLVIPSGIRCSRASAIERYFKIPSVGIITTKSISYTPKEGYREPLYAKIGENSYTNAVGLANPGAVVFRDELSRITIPENKFLLVSIFGGDVDSFLKAAQTLAPFADGFELNMSCPHAKGYGLQVGSDIALVSQITKKLCESFDIPIFVKLSATIPNAAQTAEAAIKAGASGITMSNSAGPGLEYLDGKPILSNIVGGISGEAVRPLALKALRDTRMLIGEQPIIIGMGGIFTQKHINDFTAAGANFFGVGSALTDLDTLEATAYLNSLQPDFPSYQLKPVENMTYQRCVVEENTPLTDVLHKIRISEWTDYEKNRDTAGKFYFLMIPEVGEKPFALFAHDDRSFIIKNVGSFTSAITKLQAGDTVYLRGPYGKGVPEIEGAVINFVAGGTGISPVYEIAREYAKENKVRFFLGGNIAGDVFDIERFKSLGEVHIATNDGSIGEKGFVTTLLHNFSFEVSERQVFVNVGPMPMIESCYPIEEKLAATDDIWVSIEYHTSCGVGICGKCANEDGAITCVDGPFLRMPDALKIKLCQHG